MGKKMQTNNPTVHMSVPITLNISFYLEQTLTICPPPLYLQRYTDTACCRLPVWSPGAAVLINPPPASCHQWPQLWPLSRVCTIFQTLKIFVSNNIKAEKNTHNMAGIISPGLDPNWFHAGLGIMRLNFSRGRVFSLINRADRLLSFMILEQ